MEAWFISDIHLKSVNERNGQNLLRFLTFILERKLKNPQKNDMHLFLLGDIFDLWLSNHKVFIKRYQPIVDLILKIKQVGISVYYFEGNHDFHVKKYWEDNYQIAVYTQATYFTLGKWIVRCEHGDMINLKDVAYQRYYHVARHPIVEAMAHHLPGSFWNWLGTNFSKESRKHSTVYRRHNETELIHMIRQHAHKAFVEKAFDFIMTGHMHVFDDHVLKGEAITLSARPRSINLGSWLQEPRAFYLNDEGGSWIKIEESMNLN